MNYGEDGLGEVGGNKECKGLKVVFKYLVFVL